ncbi:SDR family oxidoreductase [Dactylosporangium sp. NPDC005572]|uniref:SDR family oxidoreductase n=1 Tax=Dactylosporangium sp. NPDC005572 TaxID=3156889 RepID=UPI0033B03B0B
MAPKTWFITGASAGLGRHMTELLLRRGDRVAATARRVHALDDLHDSYAGQLWVAHLDVTDTGELRNVVDAAFASLGRIDVVVSNAGSGLVGAAEEVTDDQLRAQIDTNLIGPIQLARAVIAKFRAQGGGRIIQVSSMVPIAIPGLSLYHAGKWGIEGFWEAVIPEVAGFGITVTLVQPGSARTAWGASVTVAHAMAEYADTPVAVRHAKARDHRYAQRNPGDPVKMAQAIIDCADTPDAPRWLPLGSDAYRLIGEALRTRLAGLEAVRSTTCATDAND